MVGQCEGQAVDAANLRQDGEALYAPPSLSYRKVRREADLIRRPEGSSKVREANLFTSSRTDKQKEREEIKSCSLFHFRDKEKRDI